MAEVKYKCDCGYVQNKAGKCPKCKVDLKPQTEKKKGEGSNVCEFC